MTSKVRVGIIGTSWWVNWLYLPSLTNHQDVDLAAICGRDRSRAELLAAKYGINAVFTDHREMIAKGGLDAIAVVTPDDLHFEMTIAALDAGLHVLCEKPLARKAVEAEAMAQRAELANLCNMVMFTWRWQPNFALMKQLVQDGFVGRIHHARFSFLGGSPGDKSYKWRFDGRRSNGVIGDIGSHMFDFARWYMGDIDRLCAVLGVFNPREASGDLAPVPANDMASVQLRMKNGANALVELSQVAHLGDGEARIGVELYGDAGTLEGETTFFGEDGGSRLRGIRVGETRPTDLYSKVFATEPADTPDLLDGFTRSSIGPRLFIDAILEGKPATPNFRDGVMAQRAVDASFRSDAEERWIGISNAFTEVTPAAIQ